MTFIIANELAFALKVGEHGVPIDLGNINNVQLVENVTQNIPMLHFIIKDVTNFTTGKSPFVDGARIYLQIGKYEEGPPLAEIPFRVVKVPQATAVAAGQGYEVYACYDAIKYLRDEVKKSYQGTVSQVFEELVTDLNLNGASTVPTNDAQVWLPLHYNYVQFIKHMIKRSYVNDQSCMAFALSAAGILFLRNLTEIFNQEPKLKLIEGQASNEMLGPKEIQIMSYSSKSNSGIQNLYRGYKSTLYQEGLDGNALNFNEVEVVKTSATININAEVRDELNSIRTELMPIDCGNTHPNFTKAEYQNARLLSLYSTVVEVLIDRYTDLDLFDCVELKLANRVKLEEEPLYSQKYILIARTRAIFGSKYYEKLLLTAVGYGYDPTGSTL